MKKKIGAILLVVALALSLGLVPAVPVAAAPTNLLSNPGAESTDMTGWTSSAKVAAVTTQSQTTGTVEKRSGSCFFDMATGTQHRPGIDVADH